MKPLQQTAVYILAVISLGCAHQPISLADINQVRDTQSTQAATFQWHWQDQPQRALAEVALMQWLGEQGGAALSVCICTQTEAQAVEQLFVGWAHLKALQQNNPALGRIQQITTGRDINGPLLRIQVQQ